MNPKPALLILLISLFFVGGCATMNQSECVNADWTIIGLEEGKMGHRPGWEVYGDNHGGRFKISINDGDYIFIFS